MPLVCDQESLYCLSIHIPWLGNVIARTSLDVGKDHMGQCTWQLSEVCNYKGLPSSLLVEKLVCDVLGLLKRSSESEAVLSFPLFWWVLCVLLKIQDLTISFTFFFASEMALTICPPRWQRGGGPFWTLSCTWGSLLLSSDFMLFTQTKTSSQHLDFEKGTELAPAEVPILFTRSQSWPDTLGSCTSLPLILQGHLFYRGSSFSFKYQQ